MVKFSFWNLKANNLTATKKTNNEVVTDSSVNLEYTVTFPESINDNKESKGDDIVDELCQ